ncbi:CinA family protein [Dermatophilaceae bacterium Soc4.6]
MPAPPEGATLAADVVARLRARGETVACAESLTGGLLTSRLVDVPGASAAVRGGVVAYATALKAELLGVEPALLARAGPVDPAVADQLARGVRARLHADWGLGTTGVAGPDPQDGHTVGTVYVAVAGPRDENVTVRALHLRGDRAAIRAATVDAVLVLLLDRLGPSGQ